MSKQPETARDMVFLDVQIKPTDVFWVLTLEPLMLKPVLVTSVYREVDDGDREMSCQITGFGSGQRYERLKNLHVKPDKLLALMIQKAQKRAELWHGDKLKNSSGERTSG